MILFKTEFDLKKYLSKHIANNICIGFVPTMGALHLGHISLIEECKKHTQLTVCSIFVNPTQFNNKEDFDKYPITIEQDIYMLEHAGCDVLFLPSVDEMYHTNFDKNKTFNLGFIATVFEGTKRPGHFNGVCMIVERLLQIVEPNILFLGQKDYQQCIVIKKLISLMQKENQIKVIICATNREKNGLAMSSRNRRLSDEAKQKACIVFNSFYSIKQNININNYQSLLQQANQNILDNNFDSIDYLSLANAETLEPIEDWNGQTKLVILFAGFIEEVRLIDNMILN